MKRLALLLCLAAGCAVDPSSMLVHPDGQSIRCASSGAGIGIPRAQRSHDQCVEDMQKIGYVKIPDVLLGVYFTLPARPLIVERVDGPARDVGILENDRVLEIDGDAIKEGVDLYRSLDKKKPGDKIRLKIRRGQQDLEVFPTLIAR